MCEFDIARVRRAETEYWRIKQSILSSEPQPLTADPTLPEFIPHYIQYCRDILGKRSWDRDEQSLRHLVKFFGAARLSEITPGDCIAYQQRRKSEGMSNRTVNLELACLRHLFNISRLMENYSGNNPVSKVRFLEVVTIKYRILTPKEEARLMAASPGYLRDIFTCALQTGMRRAEILSLTWDNVDLRNDYIYVEYLRTKTKRIRKVPISATLKDLLKRLRNQNKVSIHVFLNSHGEPYGKASNIQVAFETARNKAGLKDFRFHDLRHTTATRLVEAGADIFSVSKILGHADVRMTAQRYAHPSQTLKDAIELLSPNIRNTVRNTDMDRKTR